MAPRKDLGSQQRGNSDQHYTSTPLYSACGTRRNGKNNGASTTQILSASYAQHDKTMRQELRHLSKNKGGTTCSLCRVVCRADGALKNAGPRPFSPPRPTQRPGAGCLFRHSLPLSPLRPPPHPYPRRVPVKNRW